MKKFAKKNNKGFSLVELIVVVLIMAIIAVALAPQVMKWVNNARISADVTTYDAVVSAAQLALTKETVYNENSALDGNAANKKVTITITDSADIAFTGGTHDALEAEMREVSDIASAKAKVKGESYVIEVYGGKVYKTSAPDGSVVNN